MSGRGEGVGFRVECLMLRVEGFGVDHGTLGALEPLLDFRGVRRTPAHRHRPLPDLLFSYANELGLTK